MWEKISDGLGRELEFIKFITCQGSIASPIWIFVWPKPIGDRMSAAINIDVKRRRKHINSWCNNWNT